MKALFQLQRLRSLLPLAPDRFHPIWFSIPAFWQSERYHARRSCTQKELAESRQLITENSKGRRRPSVGTSGCGQGLKANLKAASIEQLTRRRANRCSKLARERYSGRDETVRLECATVRRAHYLAAPRRRLPVARECLDEIALAESHNALSRQVENKTTLGSLRQTKPALITRPRNRMTFRQAVRNSSHGLPPPYWLSNGPAKPSSAGIAELRRSAVDRHWRDVWKRASQ